MVRRVSLTKAFALVSVLSAFTVLSTSCSSNEPSNAGGTGGTGTSGTGGKSGSGGSTGGKGGSGGSTGGSGGSTGDGGDPYACFAKQVANPDPGGTVTAGGDCCYKFGTCTAATSVPASLVASLGHAECTVSPSLLCAPKDPSTISSLDGGGVPKCHLTYGTTSYEGRCLPKCFTLGNPAAQSLGPGDCSQALATQMGVPFDQVVCAPCYNPIDATSTGACSQFGDAPVDTAPTKFADCGVWAPDGGTPTPAMGYCVPMQLITNVVQDTSQIPQDICPTGYLCAPKNKVADPNLCFAKCTSAIGGGAAACVPTYLVEAPNSPGQGYSATLGQVTCATGETCTPCISPLDGTVTGACNN